MQFKAWWAHDLPAEKAAFEGLIDWIAERRQRHPGLHVYHYASYEKTALGTLAARHQTRERLIDQWLTEGVLVDLYPIVRHGLLLGAPSYSIKKVELLYQPARDGAVETAADSVVQYAEWLRSGEPRRLEKHPPVVHVCRRSRTTTGRTACPPPGCMTFCWSSGACWDCLIGRSCCPAGSRKRPSSV